MGFTLYYISDSRIPTEKAHGYTQCKMCESLGLKDLRVEFWYPRRKTWIQEDLFNWYNLGRIFTPRRFWFPDIIHSDILRGLRMLVMCLNLPPHSLCMTRNHLALRILTRLGHKVVFEKHSPCDYTHKNIIGVYDACNWGSPIDPSEFPPKVDLYHETKVIGHVGNFNIRGYDKGSVIMRNIAQCLGLDWVEITRERRKVALLKMSMLDVGFVGPYSNKTHRGGRAHPVKLREYMMVGVPVVADRNSVFPHPKYVFWTNGSQVSYIEATKMALTASDAWLQGAKEEAQKWTWDMSAQKVLDLLNNYVTARD